jgi:hypothetical protein
MSNKAETQEELGENRGESMFNFDNNGKLTEPKKEMVNHPTHYGAGPDDPYEVIKIIEHYNLSFSMGNVLKYMLRAGKKDEELQDLKKALWYLTREVKRKEVNNG